ncbi:5-(carboxyamino)imidazole ribonucleotide synthase [Salinarimonas ramus]|uniref:N5-carboxyaminoimidazole ribonucleotide synthase n=1 Tax=Salinarimonas ramus TaxID=690164 RepID=A0A917QE68_9HYPH|nr:5-(carboxyamino)imidazole ribonucleotide synthase [Salinarimonas ramus]GGK46328.1 N5-carboxyaminoimidazole ribonucleotide synthase [Salinarimonas ramus]
MSGIAPGDVLGILGGGQLGRMIAVEAARLGLVVHVFNDDPRSPAFEVAARATHARFTDTEALAEFAGGCAVVTYEFENVPVAAAEIVERHALLRPGARALATAQDRLVEKTFVADLGIPVAPFRAVDDLPSLEAALADLGRPAILKTRRFGYDGKGQVVIREGDDASAALDAIAHAPAILEGFVPFSAEISVVAARGPDGGMAVYDPCENRHEGGILARTSVPAAISAQAADEARAIASRIAAALDYVGVLAVEMFLVREGGSERLVVNEMAPRVHNSGHWTDIGAATSQFEQHVRAVCGWPLGDTARRAPRVVMDNLVGEDAHRWREILSDASAHLTLYGKGEARAGRKMGHVTRLSGGR